jgi:hypothetical protein
MKHRVKRTRPSISVSKSLADGRIPKCPICRRRGCKVERIESKNREGEKIIVGRWIHE